MIDISRKTCERNGVETVVDKDRILWLTEKHIEERLARVDAGGCHCCQCSTTKWLTLISKVEFSSLKML